MKTLSIIIPVYNEEVTLQELVEKVINTDLSPLRYYKEIILVNDGSKDHSEEIIQTKILPLSTENCKIKYLKNEKNSWKGFSIKHGFQYATWDLMIIQDADLEYFPEKDYKSMIEQYEETKAEVIYGSRTLWMKIFQNNYSTKAFKLWGLLVSWITSILSFKKVTDEPTCYKMFHKKVKSDLLIPWENWFEYEPAVTMLLLRKKYQYSEIPIHYHARAFEEWKKIKRQDWIKAIFTLIKWRFKKIS